VGARAGAAARSTVTSTDAYFVGRGHGWSVRRERESLSGAVWRSGFCRYQKLTTIWALKAFAERWRDGDGSPTPPDPRTDF
jgi:hypothetical protein